MISDPAQFGAWFEEKTAGVLSSLEALALESSVDRPNNEAK